MANFQGHVDFNPETDIPSQANKVIFITGGTAGIGKQTVLALARHQPAHIYFTGRNAEAAQAVSDEVRTIDPNVGTTFIRMDMTSLSNVKKACAEFTHEHLDLLVNNAGVMYLPAGLSAEGYENHFAINHLAHAMIIRQLLPVLEHTAATVSDADVRVINLTSDAWKMHPKDGITFGTLWTKQEGFLGEFARYGQSKFANLVYTSSLAHHVPSSTRFSGSLSDKSKDSNQSGIMFVAVHPGAVATGLATTKLNWYQRIVIWLYCWSEGITLLPEHMGAYSQLWAAAGAPRHELVNGGYYVPVGLHSDDKLDEVARSEKLRDELWDYTERVLDAC